MKKCASCTKDLPDAALHCVFCGAKQAPAPAPAGNAKTVMGYSSNEVLEQLKAQQAAQRANAPSQPPPMNPPPMAQPMNPPPMQPMNPPPMAQPHGMAPTMMAAPPAGMVGGVAPHAAQASTIFVENAGPPGVQMPQQAPYTPPAPTPYTPPAPVAPVHTPPAYNPVPVAQPQPMMGHAVAPAQTPYTTAARAGRPVEPWKDTLRLVMFVFGGMLLAAFAVPLRTDPLVFNWDAIIHGDGAQKIGPLLIAAIGLVSILIAAIPMTTAPRGMLAAILGLAGALVPMLIGGMPEWPVLSIMGGLIFLVPGLLLRSEYRDASLPRILVTVGVIGVMLPFVIPMHGGVMIVMLFQGLTEAPGAMKVLFGMELAFLLIVCASLLAWAPSPGSGGAKPLAWILILWAAISTLTLLLASGSIGDVISGAPYTAVSWIAGGGLGGKDAAGAVGIPVAYLGLLGYGLATVFGKQLE